MSSIWHRIIMKYFLFSTLKYVRNSNYFASEPRKMRHQLNSFTVFPLKVAPLNGVNISAKTWSSRWRPNVGSWKNIPKLEASHCRTPSKIAISYNLIDCSLHCKNLEYDLTRSNLDFVTHNSTSFNIWCHHYFEKPRFDPFSGRS